MADDKVYNFAEAFLSGAIDRDEFWRLAKFNYPTHQVMLAEAALSFLHFEDACEVGEDQ